jgi:hypothetical protein
MPEATLTSDAVTVRIERRGHPAEVRTVTDDNRSSVVELLAGLSDETDVILGLETDAGTLLIALDRAKATIGLDSLDGTYQYVAGEPGDGHATLIVGGQQTDIDRRYVVGTSEAVDVVRAWLSGSPLPAGEWERR